MKRALFVGVVCILILGYVTAFSIVNFYGFTTFLNPDMYSDTLIARYMWEEKTLFPNSWVFGNQYYVIATPVLAALFYGITGSMNTSMALATSAMTLLLFVLLYMALRPYLPRRYCLLGILTLAASNIAINLSFNWEAQLLFTMASYYACYLITFFAVMADYAGHITGRGKPGLLSLIVCGALCFCTGMQSIRQTAIMIVPVVGFEFLRIFYALAVKREEKTRALFQPTVRVCVYAVTNFLGLVYIRLLDIPSKTIYGKMGLASPAEWGDNLQATVQALGQMVGFGNVGIHDNGWFIAVFAAFAVICTIFALVLAMYTKNRGGVEVYLFILSTSVAELFVGSIVVNFNIRSLYFFLWFPLMALSQVYLVLRLRGRWRTAFVILVLTLSAANLVYSYRPNIEQMEYHLKYAPAEETPEREAAKWLCDNGYEIVYGSYFPPSTIAAESDGQVIAGWWEFKMFEGSDCINALDIYLPEKNEKAAYYLTDEELPKAMEHAQPYGGLTCLVHFGSSGLYRSDHQLMTMPE